MEKSYLQGTLFLLCTVRIKHQQNRLTKKHFNDAT